MLNIFDELERLKEDDFIWVVYFFIVLANLFNDNLERNNILTTNDSSIKKIVNNVDIGTLIAAFLIYLFFVYRNLRNYLKSNKTIDEIALVGSLFFLIGGALIIYVNYKRSLSDELGII